MLNKRLLSWPLLALMLTSCVTINIYFPSAAAENAARTIVRGVLGEPAETQPAQSPQPGPQSAVPVSHTNLLVVLVDRLIPAAHAAGRADIKISTPAISALRARMAQRQKQLAPFYQSGAIGFDNNGLIAIHNLGAVSLRDRNRLRQLVSQENANREALYREIARANGHPEWASDIRATFAKVWVQEAPKGYWYRTDSGSWQQR